MKLHRFSVAMALVLPLMDFPGPEFNVSLTYFPCLCAVSIPSVQPRSDVWDFSPQTLTALSRECSPPPDPPETKRKETDQEQHFVNHEHDSFH